LVNLSLNQKSKVDFILKRNLNKSSMS